MYEAAQPTSPDLVWGLVRTRWTRAVSTLRGSSDVSTDDLVRCVGAIADARDKQAFSVLFAYFAPRLKTYFVRGGAGAAVAEELVQDTMLTVWRKASYFDPSRAGVSTWIFTIARNLRIDQLRRDRNPAGLPVEPEDAPPSLEKVVLDAERDQRVRDALVQLSADQMTILRLSFYSEKSQSEIAGELGIPLGTVKSRVRLAMNRLRTLLGSQS
jgi:RNA polymerase sigma-70 factor, ECF subfamily